MRDCGREPPLRASAVGCNDSGVMFHSLQLGGRSRARDREAQVDGRFTFGAKLRGGEPQQLEFGLLAGEKRARELQLLLSNLFGVSRNA